jgi:hypothetical protein
VDDQKAAEQARLYKALAAPGLIATKTKNVIPGESRDDDPWG